MRCPNCDFENSSSSAYCEQCGAPLVVQQPIPDRTELSAPQIDYSEYSAPPPPPLNGHEVIPPPPPPLPSEYTAYGSYGSTQAQIFTDQKIISRSAIGVFSAILYFTGALIAVFGLIGSITTFGPGAGGIALFLGIALLTVSIAVFPRLRRRLPLLRWWQRILWILGATALGFIGLIIETALALGPTVTNFTIGCIFLLYGIAWVAIAVW